MAPGDRLGEEILMASATFWIAAGPAFTPLQITHSGKDDWSGADPVDVLAEWPLAGVRSRRRSRRQLAGGRQPAANPDSSTRHARGGDLGRSASGRNGSTARRG